MPGVRMRGVGIDMLYQPKFDQNMDIVFKSGTLTIYRRKPTAAQ